MIRLAGPQDETAVLHAARRWPVCGCQLEMHWHIGRRNPRAGYNIYLVGGGALLLCSGQTALLCGMPANNEELLLFLQQQRIAQLTAVDFALPGWQLAESHVVLRRKARAQPATAPFVPDGLVEMPSAGEVLAVLEATDGPLRPAALRDAFYVDYNIRRNHGCLAVYGIKQNGALVSTAGLYALTEQQGYLACVETRAEHRGRGLAGALLRLLCGRHGHRTLNLRCQQKLAGFYRPFGFVPSGHRCLVQLAG